MDQTTNVAVALCVHDDTEHLASTLSSFESVPDRYVFVSKVPWAGQAGNWKEAQLIAKEAKCKVVTGDWTSEHDHRVAAFSQLTKDGFTHALIPDGDEVIEPALLETLLKIAKEDLADRVYVEWDTYWKDPYHVVRPREGFTPCMLLRLDRIELLGLRNFGGGRSLLLNGSYGIVHHLSYAGSDERIARKVTSWSHRDEVVPDWWEHIWKGWDREKRLANLHPTHPQAYAFVEHIELPCALEAAGYSPEVIADGAVPTGWPTISVVIPLCGGPEDITDCLNSLVGCFSLLHEVIVVDNGSEDGADKEAEQLLKRLPGGRMIRLGENRGFAHASNRGYQEAAGEVVLFLNSDTVVPRVGLTHLIGSLVSSGTVAAAGPLSNRCGHQQQTPSTYTSMDTMDLFALDFANGSGEDRETDMLVGFCLAVRRSAVMEVGAFDESFGLGMFEDNDLCYRLRRAGYRLVISGKAFIHHGGSKTIQRIIADPPSLLALNQVRFQRKWATDIESGYASGLSGMQAEPIRFEARLKPEKRMAEIAKLAKDADISLCMIVKNEERVLADCLRSAMPFFKETIVVDTGSTDSTVAIAEGFGARVVSFPWTDSFSEARNESLKHAKGKWIFWLDADDTLPMASGEEIVRAALGAPKDVCGFVVPVRFADEGPHGGVQVDHVKLFRNLKGVGFEGHIHEQILGSLRSLAGEKSQVARLNAYVVHSGYDTSDEGQARKRDRDEKLLKLDLAKRPQHPFVLFNLGMTAHYTDRHEEAVRWLEKSLYHSDKGESHVRKTYALLGMSLAKLLKIEEARVVWREGLGHCPGDTELHFHLGRVAADLGELDEAKHHYEQTIHSDVSGHYSSIDRGLTGYKTMHNLAGVELQRGDYNSARNWYMKAIECAPEFRPSAFSLFDAARQVGDQGTIKWVLDFIEREEGRSESWQKMRQAL